MNKYQMELTGISEMMRKKAEEQNGEQPQEKLSDNMNRKSVLTVFAVATVLSVIVGFIMWLWA